MKTAAIIQARMGSTRLPGKVLKKVEGKSMLSHVITRVSQSKTIDNIIIATTNKERDYVICEHIDSLDARYFRGSEENVLNRYYNAAKKFDIDPIVRITSDCPLIDPFVIDEIINFYEKNQYKMVTNAGPYEEKRTFPRGFDVEVFSFSLLEQAYENAEENYQKEHVTPYIYENHDDKIHFYQNEKGDYSNLRLTVDTPEDFKLIKKIYDNLYEGKHNFYSEEIIEFLNKNPELININKKVTQKNLND